MTKRITAKFNKPASPDLHSSGQESSTNRAVSNMETKQKEKGHWFNVVIFGLILKAAISLYSILTFFGDPKVEDFLSNSNIAVNISYYSLGLFTFAIAPFVLAMFLLKRWFYKICIALSVFVCLGVPWGTALGVFTIILLRRESIKNEFGISTKSMKHWGRTRITI